MTIWLDAQLPPSVAGWIEATFGIECRAVRDLGLRDAQDPSIFLAARDAGVIVMTKDRDFVDLQRRLGPPPMVLWVTCGNTSNARLREILARVLPAAMRLIEAGESLVEIGDAFSADPPSETDV
jgi:predicted nuclease of predicted toxin-antitoxin system